MSEKQGIQRIMGLSPKSIGYVSRSITDKELTHVPYNAKWHFHHKAYTCDYDSKLLKR